MDTAPHLFANQYDQNLQTFATLVIFENLWRFFEGLFSIYQIMNILWQVYVQIDESSLL